MIRLELQSIWMVEINSEQSFTITRQHVTSVGWGSGYFRQAGGIGQDRKAHHDPLGPLGSISLNETPLAIEDLLELSSPEAYFHTAGLLEERYLLGNEYTVSATGLSRRDRHEPGPNPISLLSAPSAPSAVKTSPVETRTPAS